MGPTASSDDRLRAKDFLLLAVASAAAILVHGYHPFVEDAEIYVPGIKQALHPELYPYNAAFFSSHAHLTFFPNLIAASVRLTRLPLDWALFAWHFGSVLLLLAGCWHIGRLSFRDRRGPRGGGAVGASLLPIPLAGTPLFILGQYLEKTAPSTPAGFFLLVYRARTKIS